MDDTYNEFSKRNAQLERANLRLRNNLDVIEADNAALVEVLREIKNFTFNLSCSCGRHVSIMAEQTIKADHPGAALLAEREDLRSALREVEWDELGYCPSCKGQGRHSELCPLPAALREE